MSTTVTGGVTNDSVRRRLLFDVKWVKDDAGDPADEFNLVVPVPDRAFMNRFVGEMAARYSGGAANTFNQVLNLWYFTSSGKQIFQSIHKFMNDGSHHMEIDRYAFVRGEIGDSLTLAGGNGGAQMDPGATFTFHTVGYFEYFL